jgi:hypothetical protein
VAALFTLPTSESVYMAPLGRPVEPLVYIRQTKGSSSSAPLLATAFPTTPSADAAPEALRASSVVTVVTDAGKPPDGAAAALVSMRTTVWRDGQKGSTASSVGRSPSLQMATEASQSCTGQGGR